MITLQIENEHQQKNKKKLFAKAQPIGFSHCKLLRHRIPSTDSKVTIAMSP